MGKSGKIQGDRLRGSCTACAELPLSPESPFKSNNGKISPPLKCRPLPYSTVLTTHMFSDPLGTVTAASIVLHFFLV